MILRLEQSDDLSCRLYRGFEERIRRFAEKYDLTCPIDALLYEMKQRWFLSPGLAGYFIDYDPDSLALRGHLASWITTAYNQNRLYVYQLEVDAFGEVDLQGMAAGVRGWIAGLNAQLPEGSRVARAEWTTWHSAETFKRYLERFGLSTIKLRTVLESDI